MKPTTMPACPHCGAAGSVRIVDANEEAKSIFHPLPKGWDLPAWELRCQCGWGGPLDPEQASALDRSQRPP